jgi:hypothetical protein
VTVIYITEFCSYAVLGKDPRDEDGAVRVVHSRAEAARDGLDGDPYVPEWFRLVAGHADELERRLERELSKLK